LCFSRNRPEKVAFDSDPKSNWMTGFFVDTRRSETIDLVKRKSTDLQENLQH